jgi:hypothetical protein
VTGMTSVLDMIERTAVRVTLGVLLGVVAGACWLWSLLAAVFHAGPVVLPCVVGLALLIPAGVLVWTSPDRPSGG